MAEELTRAASSDVSKRFGYWYDEAMTRPVEVERNGIGRVVMLSAREYARLARLDHVALAPSELDEDDVKALRDAEYLEEGAQVEAAAGG